LVHVAGLTGAVRWAAPEAKALSGSVLFRLQVKGTTEQLQWQSGGGAASLLGLLLYRQQKLL